MNYRTQISTSLLAAAMLAATFATMATPSTSYACTPAGCDTGYTLPRSGEIPGGVDTILWVPHSSAAVTGLEDIEASDIEVVKVEGDGESTVALTLGRDEQQNGIFALQFDEPLQPDSEYKVYSRDLCDANSTEPTQQIATLRTGPEAAEPTSLGELVVGDAFVDDLDVATDDGSCNMTIGAVQLPVELDLSADAAAWENMFRYQTFVRVDGDDERGWWPSHSLPEFVPVGESWQGRGEDLLFAMCEPPEHGSADGLAFSALEEGTHEVFMRATIPGTDVSLETEPVQFVLDCDGESGAVDGDAGAGDTGLADVGSGGDAELSDRNSPEGCSCSVDGGRPGPLGALGLFVLVGFAAIRRSNK